MCAAVLVTAGLDAALGDGAGMGSAAIFAGGRLGLVIATVGLDALGLGLAGGDGTALPLTAGFDAALGDRAGMGSAAIFAGGRLGLVITTVGVDALGVHFAAKDGAGVGVAATLNAALDLSAGMGSAAVFAGRRLGHFAVVFDAGRGNVASALGAGLTLIALFDAAFSPIEGSGAASLDALIAFGTLIGTRIGTLIGTLTACVIAALVVFFEAALRTFTGGSSGTLSTGATVIALFDAGFERCHGAVSTPGDAGAGVTLIGQINVGGLSLMCVPLAAQRSDGFGLNVVEHGVEAVGLLVG